MQSVLRSLRTPLTLPAMLVVGGLALSWLTSCFRSGFDVAAGEVQVVWEARPTGLCPGADVELTYTVVGEGAHHVDALRISPGVGEVDPSAGSASASPTSTTTYDIEYTTDGSTWLNPGSADPIEVRVLATGQLEKISIPGVPDTGAPGFPCGWEGRRGSDLYSENVWVSALVNRSGIPLRVEHVNELLQLDIDAELSADPADRLELAAPVPIRGTWTFVPADLAAMNAAIAMDPHHTTCDGLVLAIECVVLCR